MKPSRDIIRLIGGTAFWVIVAVLTAGYLAPLGHYLDVDHRELAFVDSKCPE